jgi:uncharacterized membrane protein YcaP (DUF421 family)
MDVDWNHLFVPTTPLFELVLRGTVMYLALLVAMRVLVRRHIGSLNLMDLLLVVLIADAAQNAMADEYRSLTEGFVICGTLIGWNYLMDALAYRSDFVARLLEPPPLPLIQHGRLKRRNMRSEFITEDEVMSRLRQQQIDSVADVRLAYLEPDGSLSAFRVDGESSSAKTAGEHRRSAAT